MKIRLAFDVYGALVDPAMAIISLTIWAKKRLILPTFGESNSSNPVFAAV